MERHLGPTLTSTEEGGQNKLNTADFTHLIPRAGRNSFTSIGAGQVLPDDSWMKRLYYQFNIYLLNYSVWIEPECRNVTKKYTLHNMGFLKECFSPH